MVLDPLGPGGLRWRCPEDTFDFETTSDVSPSTRIVGQSRAEKAVKLGLEISSIGYNMFVTGVSGTGRETTVKRILDQIDTTTDDLEDICFVYGFKDPSRPEALFFPSGDGSKFSENLEECVELLKSNIPTVIGSEKTSIEKRTIVDRFREQKEEMTASIEKEAVDSGFAVVNIPVSPEQFRPDVLPVIDGQPVTFDQLKALTGENKISEQDMKKYREVHDQLFAMLTDVYRRTRTLELEVQHEIVQLYRSLLRPTVLGILERLKETGGESARQYALDMAETILQNLETFAEWSEDADPYYLFTANLIVDNSESTTRPIIIEQFPDVISLFGNIDRILVDNKPYADHTMIRAGSILRANGGYLILNGMDLIQQPGLWQQLTQTLRNQTVVIRSHDPMRLFPVELQPEPIDIDVKVILIGPSWLYELMAANDPEFGLLFRIRADFDDRMEITKEHIQDFSRVIALIMQQEKLLPLDRSAMAAVAEQAVRLTGQQDRISTKFNLVADYVRQAVYWARQDGKDVVKAEHVKKAIWEKRYRLSLGEDYAISGILTGQVMIDTEGEEVGQVNGLAVYQGVDYGFGLPARITARVSAGREGIINIEREAELSGPLHTKGVMVISGFLRGKFAADYPLCLSASICFEQSYGGVDGDSASSTELYALLSALSGLPIRQDIAITGSVNQLGHIQTIGGVNQKIEGFFRICSERGLTGTQGVLIPSSNKRHLQLDYDVIKAVEDGIFGIYPASLIEEGIELLTGVPAGERLPDGSYPADTVYGRVDRKLEEMADTLRAFSYDT
jgi:lon-related putative ATP-dependent protease